MPETERGITYPDAQGSTQLWQHYQNLAETADAAIDAAVPVDTGWITLPLASGYDAHATPGTPKYRKIGSVVYLRGGVTNDAGSLPVSTNGVLVATLPDGFYPNASHQYMGVPQSPTTAPIRWFVQSDGRILLYVHGASTAYAGMATCFPIAGG